MKWTDMTAMERDALVSQKVMGIDLKPVRSMAMVRVGWNHISVTGNPFQVSVAGKGVESKYRSVTVPSGESLPQPEGTTHWNDRYAYYIAQQFEDEWADEIDALTDVPKPYTTDVTAAWEVVEKMRQDGHDFDIGAWNKMQPVWSARFPKQDVSNSHFGSSADSAPEAICLAALRAVGVDVE